MIRNATVEDIPRIIELGAQMHAESVTHRDMTYAADHVEETVSALIAGPMGFAIVYESNGDVIGFVLALCAKSFFGPDITAGDLAVFVEKKHRGGMAGPKLVSAYEKWARSIGAKSVQLGVMTGVDVDRTATMCERMGWRLSGLVMEA